MYPHTDPGHGNLGMAAPSRTGTRSSAVRGRSVVFLGRFRMRLKEDRANKMPEDTARRRGRGATRTASRWILCLAWVTTACSTQPVFLPGTGGSEFGTIDDQQGNTYKITELAGDSIRVDAEGVGGDLTFTFDSDGRLTNITSPDGSNINFNHQANGTIQVSGTGTFEGQQTSFNFTITPGNSAKQKHSNDAAASAPFVVCAIIDAFCNDLEAIIAELLPPLIDEFINDNLPALITEFNKQSFIPIPEGVFTSFPTGVGAFDDFVRNQARQRIEPLLAPVREFCARWQLLRLLEISACDAVGS